MKHTVRPNPTGIVVLVSLDALLLLEIVFNHEVGRTLETAAPLAETLGGLPYCQ